MKKNIRVLLVDDEAAFRGVMKTEIERMGFSVLAAGGGREALDLLRDTPAHVAVLDVRMPDMDGLDLLREIIRLRPDVQAIMLTGQGTIESAVESLQRGAFHYLTKPCRLAELKSIITRAAEKTELMADRKSLDLLLDRRAASAELVGVSDAIRQIVSTIDAVAPTDSPVLIHGESGTGKEMAAQAIHRRSRRARRPFIPVNCAAFSEGILESELFGHEKGAFTGATADKQGLFEAADGGTIFLDEIAEMRTEVQAKLLRVIESGEVRRVGSVKPSHVDTRVIAATNADVEAVVKNGQFRQDLYFRLNVVAIEMPPLRTRKEDIPILVSHFMERSAIARPVAKELAGDAMEVLKGYHWPGNVRELQNLVERLLILSRSERVDTKELFRLAPSLTMAPDGNIPSGEMTIDALERAHILNVLKVNNGNKETSAKVLGISLKTLYNKLKEYGERGEVVDPG